MSLVDQIPQTIKEIGRANAAGRLAGGRWGVAIADIGQQIGRIPEINRRRQSEAMSLQINQLRLQQAQREAAADQAISNAMSAALTPEGAVDPNKLAQHLAGTPGATKLPELMEHFNRLQESSLRLKTAQINAVDAEDDSLGAMAHAASLLEHPEDQAAMLATGIASGVKQGTINAQHGKELLGSLLTGDGTPDPAKVSETIKVLKGKSKEQRTLAATDEQKRAAAASADALAEQREEATKEKKAQTALGNFSRQLGATKSRERYAQVYAGIPEEYRSYFDAPEDWTAQSAENAALALSTPADRIRLKSEQRQADTQRRQLEISQGNLDVSRGRLQLEKDKEAEKETSAKAAGAKDSKELTQYKDFTTRYERARDEERQRASRKTDWNTGESISLAPPYVPPPSIEKWRQMSATERQQVIVSPAARIDDAEMGRRAGTPTNTPTSTTPMGSTSAAPPRTGGKPAPKIGDVVMVQGKRVQVTGFSASGKVQGKVLP